MAHVVIMTVIGLAVVAATIGMMWQQWLENRRQMAALEIIGRLLEKGQEPPAQLYIDLNPRKTPEKTTPLGAAGVFIAIAIGFAGGAWLSWRGSGAAVLPFSIVAAVMAVLGVVSLIVAAAKARRKTAG